ncbi:DlpA domain protein [Aspergillus campestris IBT 28561]|uniref:DlpA domain protein n=1 Tax=Aspergillus campestris (strain IBT 28561) TaxID=1392248 RepID=A0A2I1CYD5_ASPC2|nr:DlpA domain protein [Aspergillus campestris IBT 28561]PKY02622.1 DlpA domain protein [Aspergillus campestris IBT 28561]
MSSAATSIAQKLDALRNYSACDVSDALLKIQKVPEGTAPRAGHLADFSIPLTPTIGRNTTTPKLIAPASTFKFIPKAESASSDPTHGFPAGTHWVDLAEPGTVAVIEQPQGQYCAVLGGIMAVRMKTLGVEGALVNGRVRDLDEIRECGLPVWAQGTSTVGTGAEAKPGARNVPVTVGGGVTVSPGDIIFCDPLEGVVFIPRDLLDQVLDVMPKLIAMDDKVKDAVGQGMSVFDAFKQFRTKI